MEDKDGNRLFINDYYFDVGTPQASAILWVKVVDDQDKLVSGTDVEIDGFTRTTDGFGRVPFLLNAGKYDIEVVAKGKACTVDTCVGSGEIVDILCSLK